VKQLGQIYFDPWKVGGKIHPIWPCVEARGKIHDHVGALLHAGGDEPVEQHSPRDKRPRVLVREV
jgi:hypothetical protein